MRVETTPSRVMRRGCVGLTTPDGHFLAGEPVTVQCLPADAPVHEVRLKGESGDAAAVHRVLTLRETNRTVLESPPEGSYRLWSRWAPSEGAAAAGAWSEWSQPIRLSVHPAGAAEEVDALRVREHRLSMMTARDAHGTLTVTDPWAWPPACPREEPIRWFRTPCYEGSGPLVNEASDYYRDPWGYYLDCLVRLREGGVAFRTWHELLDGEGSVAEREVVLQFDVDAGRRSIERLIPELLRRGIRANLMIHRVCHDWYAWSLEDLDLDLFKEAERAGWAIGYHNNALGNVQRLERVGDYEEATLAEASRRVVEDVRALREHFRIRTLTHHGGNVLNKLTPVPAEAEVVCVDRGFNRPLYERVRGSFSDGGFASRPGPLREAVTRLEPGLHFFRNHPVKYANFEPPYDVPPLELADAETRDEGTQAWIDRERAKQARWLAIRDEHRLAVRLDHSSAMKPISERFRPWNALRDRIERFHARRRPTFLRMYPDPKGDPRVFWWRLLDAWAPKTGRILNVGAMPSDRRDETTAFTGEAEVVEMDVDERRRPHVLGDITQPAPSLEGQFDAVFLFGLPCIDAPSAGVGGCARVLREDGVGIFGFTAETHPSRGGLWRPEDRPVWRPEDEPLASGDGVSRLWSFDAEAPRRLFASWRDVRVEFFGHYWFVIGRCPAEGVERLERGRAGRGGRR